jgi:signal transduction histidine kinase
VGLRWRLLLPMVALMLLVVGGTVLVTQALVGRAVERRLADQVDDLARFISSPKVPVNVRMLEHVAGATNAQGVLIGGRGQVHRGLSTLSAEEAARVLGGGSEWLVLTAPMELREGDPPQPVPLTLYVVWPPDLVERQRQAALGPLPAVGVASVALSAILAIVLAMTIARPIEALARAAARHPPSDLPEPAEGPREVRALAAAFNRLLGTVRRSEQLSTVGRVAAMMAHEMRNPLASMKLNVQLMESRGDAATREHARRLLSELDRLGGALDLLLDAARPSPLRKEPVSLRALVQEVAGFLQPRLDHWKVAVAIDAPGEALVRADPGRLRGVVMNLLLNAAQAMPGGGTVRVRLQNGAASAVRLIVEDGGVGVPESIRGRLFEPFVTTREDGMGLGLAVTRGVIEEHGGRVGYEPASPGSRFWVELPA